MITLRIRKNEKSGKFGAYTFARKRGEHETIQAALDAELPGLVQHATRFAEPIEIQVTFRKKQK